MSLWKIAWRSIQHRSLASGLTAFSMSLGVALVVAVLVVHGVVDRSFRRGAQGYNLIVGPKGSELSLTLNTVYYLEAHKGTIPYEYYTELAHGRFKPDVDFAVPICTGGNYKGFPIVGTMSKMFTDIQYAADKQYTFSKGANFRDGEFYTAVIGSEAARKTGLTEGDTFRPIHGMDPNQGEEHDPFKIVGVLDHTGTPNDRAIFVNIQGFFDMHEHDHGASDAIEGSRHDDEAPAEEDAHEGHEHEGEEAAEQDAHAAHEHGDEETADEEEHEHPESEAHVHDENCPADCGHDHSGERAVSAILVASKQTPTTSRALPDWIGEELDAMAVQPTAVITKLFENMIGELQKVLVLFAVLVIIVAGIGMMVSIYNSMSERRHEIAVMRALGARRSTVMQIILLESILLSLGGGALGLIMGHGLTWIVSGPIYEHTGVAVNPFSFLVSELYLIPGLIALASVVGYLPAVVAYRTEVADSLGE